MGIGRTPDNAIVIVFPSGDDVGCEDIRNPSFIAMNLSHVNLYIPFLIRVKFGHQELQIMLYKDNEC